MTSVDRIKIEAIKARCQVAREALQPLFVQGDATLTDALGSASVKIADVERLCDIRIRDIQRYLDEGKT